MMEAVQYPPASPQGVTTQKTNIDIFTAVRTSNLIIYDPVQKQLQERKRH
jgi:hypothetical protein